MGRLLRIRRILVPTDFSKASRAAYPLAAALARKWGAGLVLLNVVDVMPLITLEGGMVPVGLPDFEGQARARMRIETRRLEGARVRTRVVPGTPDVEIVREARKLKCDLVVMSTHGRRGFARWILGSVAERVLRRAACPVLVVKPK